MCAPEGAHRGICVDTGKPSRLDEATAWFAAMRKSVMTTEERANFDAWRADPRNQAALDALHELWGELAVLKYLKPAPQIQRRRSAPAVAAAAAVLVLACGVMTSFWVLRPGATIETAIGEQRTQTLPDGSVLALNVVSRVSYAFTDTTREVTLHGGEAAFTVQPDKQKPFVVHTGGYDVRAVGTAFNVRQRDGYLEVAVADGAVNVCTASRNGVFDTITTLSAGQSVRLPMDRDANEGSLVERRTVAISDVAQWRTRVVAYEEISLGDVLADLNRYFSKDVQIVPAALLEKRVTIRLQIDDRERAVATLASLLQLRVRDQPSKTELVQ